jgi:hypothetical protein
MLGQDIPIAQDKFSSQHSDNFSIYAILALWTPLSTYEYFQVVTAIRLKLYFLVATAYHEVANVKKFLIYCIIDMSGSIVCWDFEEVGSRSANAFCSQSKILIFIVSPCGQRHKKTWKVKIEKIDHTIMKLLLDLGPSDVRVCVWCVYASIPVGCRFVLQVLPASSIQCNMTELIVVGEIVETETSKTCSELANYFPSQWLR